MWLGANSKQDSWFGTNRYVTQYVTMNRLANPDLGWGKLFQADLGLDFDFLQAFARGRFLSELRPNIGRLVYLRRCKRFDMENRQRPTNE